MTDLPYPLDLGDGREPIMCRDAHQASLLLGIWRAWCGGVRAEMGLGLRAAGADVPGADLAAGRVPDRPVALASPAAILVSRQ